MKRIEYNPDKPAKKERLHRKLARHGGHHIRRRPYLLPIFGFVLGIGIVGSIVLAQGGAPNKPSESHVVYLYDKGKRQTLDTKVGTVGELIDKLPLNLIPQDVVEPSRNSHIAEDNFRINVYRARPVTVVDTNKRTVTLTAQKSARVVAQGAGLDIFPEDKPVFAQGTLRENIIGEKVVIERATPVYLNLYGTPVTVRTFAETVGDLLAEKGVQLSKGDKVQPKEDMEISEFMQIYVSQTGIKISTVKEVIEIPVEYVKDRNLTSGTTALRQEGREGKRVVTYQLKTKNGKIIGRKMIQTIVIEKPVPRILAVGSAPLSLSLQQWLYKLRTCESGGNYKTNTGNGFYGAYQFMLSTWQRIGYSGYPHEAPPSVQDQAIVVNTNRSSGGLASQNPGCYASTGISQFPPSNR
jgi:resuscitation-promoting factor RpfB